LSPKTILLVDDDPDQHETCGIYLQHLGYRVLSVLDGASAVVLASAVPVDLVLLDLHMPRVNGLEVAQRLRSQPESAAVPVIMVTADSVRAATLPRDGIAGVIIKPCALLHLAERVRGVIGDP
jgi:DNA-binding response OmpR family regulator